MALRCFVMSLCLWLKLEQRTACFQHNKVVKTTYKSDSVERSACETAGPWDAFFPETLTEGSAACDVRVARRTFVCCSVLCESPVAFGSSRGLSFWASAHKFLRVEVTILFCLKFPWFFIRELWRRWILLKVKPPEWRGNVMLELF